jgi:hypothetical protein
VLGRPVQPFAHHSPSAIGAALLGSDADALTRPAAEPAEPTAAVQPGAAAEVYRRLYQRYVGLFPRIAETPSNTEKEGK